MIIIGIDPGLNNTGWGVIEYSAIEKTNKYINAGVITPKKMLKSKPKKQEIECTMEGSFFSRIKTIHEGLVEILKTYPPEIIVLEKIFVNNNMKSSLDFAYARGSIMLTLALHTKRIEEISPNLMKKRVTGNGHASKDQVIYMVERILNIKLEDQKADLYDALALTLAVII